MERQRERETLLPGKMVYMAEKRWAHGTSQHKPMHHNHCDNSGGALEQANTISMRILKSLTLYFFTADTRF